MKNRKELIRKRIAEKRAARKAEAASESKSVVSKVIEGEKIRDIILNESPYPGSAKDKYPAGGDLGPKKAKTEPENPKNSKVDIKPSEDAPKGPFTRDSSEVKSLKEPTARMHNRITSGTGKKK